jgi:transposase-like protein
MPSRYKPKPPREPWSRKKLPPTGTDADLNLTELVPLFTDECKAREFLEARRWPNGPVCPRCDYTKVYKLTAKPGSKYPTKPGNYKCGKCRKRFTVRIGTIFEESKIPLHKWLMAFHLLTSSKKGMSSLQLSRELGITVNSAWFLSHRIRESMKDGPVTGLLKGTVEVDETYVGGKPRKGDGKEHKRGRGTAKTPVLVLIERDGAARSGPLGEVTGKSLKGQIRMHVATDSVIVTDELASYGGLEEEFAGHEKVKHGGNEFARDAASGLRVHTNTAESYFALLKRMHYGVYHKMSKQHLPRYCAELEFRWNRRKVTDGERMVSAIKGGEGKRLMYRPPKDGAVVKALGPSKEEKELLDSITF